jgi:hypothetical protein
MSNLRESVDTVSRLGRDFKRSDSCDRPEIIPVRVEDQT